MNTLCNILAVLMIALSRTLSTLRPTVPDNHRYIRMAYTDTASSVIAPIAWGLIVVGVPILITCFMLSDGAVYGASILPAVMAHKLSDPKLIVPLTTDGIAAGTSGKARRRNRLTQRPGETDEAYRIRIAAWRKADSDRKKAKRESLTDGLLRETLSIMHPSLDTRSTSVEEERRNMDGLGYRDAVDLALKIAVHNLEGAASHTAMIQTADMIRNQISAIKAGLIADAASRPKYQVIDRHTYWESDSMTPDTCLGVYRRDKRNRTYGVDTRKFDMLKLESIRHGLYAAISVPLNTWRNLSDGAVCIAWDNETPVEQDRATRIRKQYRKLMTSKARIEKRIAYWAQSDKEGAADRLLYWQSKLEAIPLRSRDIAPRLPHYSGKSSAVHPVMSTVLQATGQLHHACILASECNALIRLAGTLPAIQPTYTIAQRLAIAPTGAVLALDHNVTWIRRDYFSPKYMTA